MIDLVLEYLSTYWSNNVKAFTPEDIVSHLKMIVAKQWSRSIPTNPPVLLPAKHSLPQLGTQALDVVAMDAARLETSDEFEQQSRCTRLERDKFGVGYRYYKMWPTSEPDIDNGLIGKRLDVCLQYFLDDGKTDILWSQWWVLLL